MHGSDLTDVTMLTQGDFMLAKRLSGNITDTRRLFFQMARFTKIKT
jgi:hypothetical protein